jgi:chaperone required for assembly of F1-ATPase
MTMHHGDRPTQARRFYASAKAESEGEGFAVKLDGRTPKSPSGTPLVLPTLALAELCASEWAAQSENIDPSTLQATRLAFTALDHIPAARAETAAEVSRYAGSDLLCYRADQPAALIARQALAWDPLVLWAEQTFDLKFVITSGIIHRPQPDQTVAEVRALAAREGDFGLTGLAFATALFGSAVIALALRHGRLTAEEAFAVSRIDEDYQIELWGHDDEAAERVDAQAIEARMLEHWFKALQ